MATLSSLPREILFSICSYLGQGDKAAVVRTARGYSNVAVAALYEKIDWYWVDDWSQTAYLSSQTYVNKVCPVHFLLRTSLERPDLVQRTKHVRFRGFSPYSTRNVEEIDEEEFRVVVTAVVRSNIANSVDLVNGKTWLEGPYEYLLNVQLAMFIFQLHNIETLSIGHRYGEELVWLNAMFRFALFTKISSPTVSRFAKLRRVELFNDMIRRCMVTYHCSDRKHKSDDILPYCYLPNLQDLRVLWPRAGESFEWLGGGPPDMTRLTRLHLRRSDFEPRHLQKVLATTRNLRHVRYDLCCEFGYNHITALDCHDLTKAFDEVAQSILSLTICLQLHPGDQLGLTVGARNLNMKGYASFANLVKLEQLEIPMIVLAGVVESDQPNIAERIPQCALKRLALRDDLAHTRAFPWRGGRMIECIDRYITAVCSEKHSGHLLGLGLVLQESRDRALDLQVGEEHQPDYETDDEWNGKTQSILSKICQKASIRFFIRDEPIGGDRIYRPYEDNWIDGTSTGHPFGEFWWE